MSAFQRSQFSRDKVCNSLADPAGPPGGGSRRRAMVVAAFLPGQGILYQNQRRKTSKKCPRRSLRALSRGPEYSRIFQPHFREACEASVFVSREAGFRVLPSGESTQCWLRRGASREGRLPTPPITTPPTHLSGLQAGMGRAVANRACAIRRTASIRDRASALTKSPSSDSSRRRIREPPELHLAPRFPWGFGLGSASSFISARSF